MWMKIGAIFIIFLSAMYFFISIKQNNEFLTLKVFGYSNFKIVLIISLITFLWGIIVLILVMMAFFLV